MNALGKYTKGSAYTFTVLAKQAGVSFAADIICWAVRVPQNYRGYDHGLHMGIPGHGDCHLLNDNGAVQMKSHITSGESPCTPLPLSSGVWTLCPFDNSSIVAAISVHTIIVHVPDPPPPLRACPVAGGSDGMGGWYGPQHAFLHHNIIQVESDAIAVWVR